MMLRPLVVAGLALLIAAQVVRTAAVKALAKSRPDAAARIWSDHPDVQILVGMTEIARATRERKAVAPAVFDQIFDASRVAPLAPEPFLVRGVQAQLAANPAGAERAFVAAKWRDPRSLPARYFLAEHYFRQRDARRGLPEIAALAALVPNGPPKLAPYLATYARDRANWAQLRAVLRSDPALEDATLATLAADAATADLVLALANPGRRGPSSPWLPQLLETLTNIGQYAKARQVWALVSNLRLDRKALIYDPQFTQDRAPPPFNWTLTSSTVGLAERQPGGGLHVIFYGQEDGALANQLLVLPAGRYRFSVSAPGAAARGKMLEWRLTCARSNAAFATAPLDAALARGWTFSVEPGCPAQRLELFGSSLDLPQQSEVVIRSVRLVPEDPRA